MVDALCDEDLDLYGRELSDPIAELDQDLFHRLLEGEGENIDDEDRGCGLRDILSGKFDTEAVQQRIVSDFKKDPRVDSVTVGISLEDGGVSTLRIGVQAIGKELGIVAEINTIEGTIIRLDG